MGALWAKLSGWLALAGAAMAALAIVFVKGRREGERDALADATEQAVKDARAAQALTVDAAKAAETVREDAAKQAPPNVATRDDLDSTF